jgi:ketosteroid isomerase-like protein
MSLIDPARTWAKVEQRLQVETDPTFRRNLATILRHMKAEAAGDVDGLLDTLSDDVHYHSYGTVDPALNPKGKEAVRRFYEDFIASGATRLQLDVDRLLVDKDCVLTEGVMRMAYPGRTLAGRGIEVDDPDGYYLYESRMAVLWPMDPEGRARGEDTYTSADGFAGIAGRQLRREDITPLAAPA